MKRHEVIEYRRDQGGRVVKWILLLGLGALLLKELVGEVPAMRRYWQMERM